jgi:hypothetical protein
MPSAAEAVPLTKPDFNNQRFPRLGKRDEKYRGLSTAPRDKARAAPVEMTLFRSAGAWIFLFS